MMTSFVQGQRGEKMKLVNLDDVRKRIEATLVFYGLDDTEMAVYLIHCCDTLPSALPEPYREEGD